MKIEDSRSAFGGINYYYKKIKKGRAKPPARRGYSAYASESDIRKSSIFSLQY
jgi:hypothetical protein